MDGDEEQGLWRPSVVLGSGAGAVQKETQSRSRVNHHCFIVASDTLSFLLLGSTKYMLQAIQSR